MSNSSFGNWEAHIHSDPAQEKRKKSAAKADVTAISIEHESLSADFQGRHGRYRTTLDKCTCADFGMRNLPCKHMYRLAAEFDLFDLGTPVKTDPSAIRIPESERRNEALLQFKSLVDSFDNDTKYAIALVINSITSLSALNDARDYLNSSVTHIPEIFATPVTVVLTGTPASGSRIDFLDTCDRYGCRVSVSPSKKTTYLVVGENPQPQKIERAKELGIKIIPHEDFIKLLKGS